MQPTMQDRQHSPAQAGTFRTPETVRKQALATQPANAWYGTADVSTRRPRDAAEQRAVGLGWFSIGLGLAQILAPRGVARMIGASDHTFSSVVVRACGVREVIAGLGILAQPRPNTFLWGRVAGDVLDIALLGNQISASKRSTGRLAISTAAVLGVTALDVKTALDLTRARRGQRLELEGVHVRHSITINASVGEVYRFWRNLENLPTFMAHLESVEERNGRVSSWRAKGPAGTSVEWEAQITADEPNSRIEWCSLPESTIPNRGSVRFTRAPGNRGTEVHVELLYEPPAGALGALVAKLFGEEPKQQIKSDLRRLKQVMETGEVTHSDSSIHHGLHPARPSGKAIDNLTQNVFPTREIERADSSNANRATGGAAQLRTSSPPRSMASGAPPKPTGGGEPTATNDAANDAIPFTHYTNNGFGTTGDDDAS